MKKLLFALLVSWVAGPAAATRMLYSYTDAENQFGFTFIQDQFLGFGESVDTAALTCFSKGALCSNVTVEGLGGGDVAVLVQGQQSVLLFAADADALKPFEYVGALNDTDAVYSYVDTRNVALTFIFGGYLPVNFDAVTTVTPLTCQANGIVCSAATATTTGGADVFNITPYFSSSVVNSIALPGADLDNEGTYSLRQGSIHAQLGVVAALATDAPPTAVPEPAMLGLFGMGAVALGLTRRRKAA